MIHMHFQDIATVPLYHWRGARPWLLDLAEDEGGWLVCLCLQREGDCCLLPLAWEKTVVELAEAHPTIHTTALDSEAVQLTLSDMQRDGWHINGRLHLHFIGHQQDPTFTQYLWHSPVDSNQ